MSDGDVSPNKRDPRAQLRQANGVGGGEGCVEDSTQVYL